MQKFNYHTHTSRCGHARGADDDYCQAAIKAGYEILGFSDHAPYRDSSMPRARMDWDMLDDYLDSVKQLKTKYEGKLDVKLGLETEFFPEYLDEKKYLKEKVDYLILGQHFSKPYRGISYFNHNSDEELWGYCQGVINGLESGLFMYLAHPDVYMFKQTEFSETCQKIAHLICAKAAETNTPMEVNVHGVPRGTYQFEAGVRYYYPHLEFWKIAAQYPVKCLIGVDAHSPDDLLDIDSIDKATTMLSGLNLEFIKEPLL